MSDQQAASTRIDLPASSLLVKHLQSVGHPLSTLQRAAAGDLKQRLRAAPWQTPEERTVAHILVLHLELLLLGREKAPSMPGKLSTVPQDATGQSGRSCPRTCA
jgi:hypothetical protein